MKVWIAMYKSKYNSNWHMIAHCETHVAARNHAIRWANRNGDDKVVVVPAELDPFDAERIVPVPTSEAEPVPTTSPSAEIYATPAG